MGSEEGSASPHMGRSDAGDKPRKVQKYLNMNGPTVNSNEDNIWLQVPDLSAADRTPCEVRYPSRAHDYEPRAASSRPSSSVLYYELDTLMRGEATLDLKSELAALDVKCDRLKNQVNDLQGDLDVKDAKIGELQTELQNHAETAARQNAIIHSLRGRLQDAEDRNSSLCVAQGKDEVALASLRRENRHLLDRLTEVDGRLSGVLVDHRELEKRYEQTRRHFNDFFRKIRVALGVESDADVSQQTPSPDALQNLSGKAAELVQEHARLKARSTSLADAVQSQESESKSNLETIARLGSQLESEQKRNDLLTAQFQRLKLEKEESDKNCDRLQRQLDDNQEQLKYVTKSEEQANGKISSLSVKIARLQAESDAYEARVKQMEQDKRLRLEALSTAIGGKGLAESMSSTSSSISDEKMLDRVKELIGQLRDRDEEVETLAAKCEQLTEKLADEQHLYQDALRRSKLAEQEAGDRLEVLRQAEEEICSAQIYQERLEEERKQNQKFLDRLAKVMRLNEIAGDCPSLHVTVDTVVARAEQLVRLEAERLQDKTLLVYQLQRKLRVLREQVDRKDLHIDLLRKKLAAMEDSSRKISLLQKESDQASLKTRRVTKLVERLQAQLNETAQENSELKQQSSDTEAVQMKLSEKTREVEVLHHRLMDLEVELDRQRKKVLSLKDNVKAKGTTAVEERRLADNAIEVLSSELRTAKQDLADSISRERQVRDFRQVIGRILGLDMANCPLPDYEIISRLQKIVSAHREFTMISHKFASTAPSFAGANSCDPFQMREPLMFSSTDSSQRKMEPDPFYRSEGLHPQSDPRGVKIYRSSERNDASNGDLRDHLVKSSSLVDLRNDPNSQCSTRVNGSSNDAANLRWLDSSDSASDGGSDPSEKVQINTRRTSDDEKGSRTKKRGSSAPIKDRRSSARKMVSIVASPEGSHGNGVSRSPRKRSSGILKSPPRS